MNPPVLDRIRAKIEPGGPRGDCWIWTASTNASGYARISVSGRYQLAHRVAYELLVGPIPEGRQLDHLCRTRTCVNPAHLEPVTQRENSRRGLRGDMTTHCPAGHAYAEHGRRRERGSRDCRACARDRERRRRAA